MGLGLAFWIVMLLWIVVSGLGWSLPAGGRWYSGGAGLLLFLLLFLLLLLVGWKVFGAPLHG